MSTTENYFEQFVDGLFVKRRKGIEGYLHAAVGMAGEAGEVLDIIKKCWAYDKEIDAATYDKLVEEMGDLQHYCTMMCLKLGIPMSDVRTANVTKLEKRYPNGYSDKAALARADKQLG